MMADDDFNVGEKILAFHEEFYWDATVLDKKVDDNGQPAYKIHYKGWNEKWDEWVGTDRLKKRTLENIAEQKRLIEQFRNQTNASKRSVPRVKKAEDAKDAEEPPLNNKRRRVATEEPPSQPEPPAPEIPIPLPDMLKVHLVNDWERVTKNQQIVPLPRSPSVKEILHRYLEHKREGVLRRGRSEDLCNEVVSGLIAYFDRALGTLLLYRFERQQYMDIIRAHPDRAMSELYGGEHLLRLFVQLPQLIAYTRMDQEATFALRDQLMDFLRWFCEHTNEFLLDEYENTAQDYRNLLKAQQ